MLKTIPLRIVYVFALLLSACTVKQPSEKSTSNPDISKPRNQQTQTNISSTPKPAQTSPKPESNLVVYTTDLPIIKSERGGNREIMYAHLTAFIKAEEWEKADRQNWELLLQNWVNGGRRLIPPGYGIRLNCADLKRMDQIWQENSGGKFGYSVQLQMIKSVGETPKSIYESIRVNKKYQAWTNFTTAVGWQTKPGFDGDFKYENLNFSLNAPRGHFPATAGYHYEQLARFGSMGTFFIRAEECEI
ncbi:GUN4 domain-containing protein [Nodularia spumigena CS-584]|uniref:GUN4 domain-containing protein n=1 Tax=Nodularia spumigena TaxID=70799 RepID=UPI0000EAAB42|nr:GUN4 domain-containing protein [Nodularia spumigena]AHJ30970.1 serine/threonine kinase [Nodularia spumigena CCY9414]EAW46382.1 hypothetical protein N9414_11759 [Nodularia spumigena CCY9414]MDB9382760.1 GUN4 domain-containing protein [Nodularia spumigena CS-584]